MWTKEVASRIRALRMARGWTQDELAEASGVARTTVAEAESGKRDQRLGTVMALAQALTSSIDHIAGTGNLIETLVPVPVLTQRIHAPDQWPADAEHIPQVKPNARLVAIEVRGDCMAPKIEEGDYVIIDRDRLAEVGKVVVFWQQGDWALKRLRRRNGHWLLVPDNPAYPPMEIDGKEVEPLGVVIRVVKPEP